MAESSEMEPSLPATPAFDKDSFSTLTDPLKLGSQLAAFRTPKQFATFIHQTFESKAWANVDFEKLLKTWFLQSMHLIDASQFKEATKITTKINKESNMDSFFYRESWTGK